MQTIETIQSELSGMKIRCEEMEQAKADTEDQVRRSCRMQVCPNVDIQSKNVGHFVRERLFCFS